jgi:hypothetical protein
MEITRDIAIDLLPLYQSGEASADTRAAVEQFLQRDPSLARLLEMREHGPSPAADLERRTVERTRSMVHRRAWTLALAILFTTMPFAFGFKGDELTFFMFRDEPGSRLLLLAAVWLWVLYARLTWGLKKRGI